MRTIASPPLVPQEAAGAAPEWMSEKAVAIGMYVTGSGIFTVFGTPLPVRGSSAVYDYLTRGMEADFGATWAFESAGTADQPRTSSEGLPAGS